MDPTLFFTLLSDRHHLPDYWENSRMFVDDTLKDQFGVTSDTTRASTISRPQTFTSGGDNQF
jgi:hypothetical protein